MYATPLTRWNAAEMGPQRDVIGELAGGRVAGLHFGVSSHRAEHWWFMDGGRDFPVGRAGSGLRRFLRPGHARAGSGSTAWRYRDDWTPRPDTAYLDDWLARTCELVDRFQPQVIYFDWWIHQLAFKPYLQRFAAYYYNRVPDGVINYKFDAFAPGTAVHRYRARVSGRDPA